MILFQAGGLIKFYMELIDTHCHLYVPAFAEDIDNIIQRARTAGVIRFYLPAIDMESEKDMLGAGKTLSGHLFCYAGSSSLFS